ncbi:sulfite exporter TauE/SafE family protein [Aureliella helgolandensis]|nr:sulfite exporter TauE/SafE family protein [Aureliella helgolandensis]
MTTFECVLLFIGAAGIGFSKSGFSGVSMLHVIIFAFVFGTKASTGVLLPMLVVGDFCAIYFFGKKANWPQVRKLLPPTLIGVVLGTLLMGQLDEAVFKPLVGTIILGLTIVQITRLWRPKAFESMPHNRAFAWSLGLLAGVTTMLANAAGPIIALYLLALMLPKLELVGTSAWLFLVINVFKLPFSYFLGLIDLNTLGIDLIFAPGVLVGMMLGSWLVHRIAQKAFDSFLLAFTAFAALRLILDPWMAAKVVEHPPAADVATILEGEAQHRNSI